MKLLNLFLQKRKYPFLKEGEIFTLETTDKDGTVDRTSYKIGALKIVPCDIKITKKTDDYIEVTVNKYVHAVELEGEMIFDDNYFSLFPNEVHRVHYKKINCASNDISVHGYTVE